MVGRDVVGSPNCSHAWRFEDCNPLCSTACPRVGDLVVLDHNVGRGRFDIEALTFLRVSIVENLVAAERVPVAAVLGRFGAEIHAYASIPRNGVVCEFVVSVFVTYGDSIVAVILDDVVLEAAVPYSPAEEKTNVAVVMHVAAADQ